MCTDLRRLIIGFLRATSLLSRVEEAAVERLIERYAGLEVHKASVTATVRVPGDQGGRRTETRTFRATTTGLVLLGDWLASFGVTVVGMGVDRGLLEAGLLPAGGRR
jgi:hypothetical protein